MGYKRKVNIELDLDEIRIICNSLRRYKSDLQKELESSIDKKGRAKKGLKISKEFDLGQIKLTEKLAKFFNGLF